MSSPKIKARNLQFLSNLAGRALKTAIALICCSGIVGVILQQIGQTCIVTFIVSMALALASQLAAYGEAPRASVQGTALIERVNAASDAPAPVTGTPATSAKNSYR